MIRDLQLTLEWLDNLQGAVGLETLLDAMPNNWKGRLALREWLEVLGGPGPGPWTFDAETGQIRDGDGWALATVPHAIAGDQATLDNGRLMAAAPALARHLARLAGCLEDAIRFAVATSPGTGHNAGMWHAAIREALATLDAAGPAGVTDVQILHMQFLHIVDPTPAAVTDG